MRQWRADGRWKIKADWFEEFAVCIDDLMKFSFWICLKFMGDYDVCNDADICLFEYYLQSCIERYLCQWNYHYCYTKKSLLFFFQNLTHHSIKLHLFLLRRYFSDSYFQSKAKVLFTVFLSIQPKNDTSSQKQINFQVMFIFLFLLIPWWFPCCSLPVGRSVAITVSVFTG